MIAALQSKALQCAQARPVSAVTLRAMMPQLESDARAERILSGLADDGHLKRIRRSGRTFYAAPEFGQIVPEARQKQKRTPPEKSHAEIMRVLAAHPRSLMTDITARLGCKPTTNAERQRVRSLYSTRMIAMLERGLIVRTSRRPYRYSNATETTP